MSFQAMAWASEQKTGSSARKLVLYSLANHANRYGYCRLGYEAIAEESELSESGVKKAIVQLAAAGFLRRERIRKTNGHLGCYEFFLAIQGPEVSLDQGPEVSRNEPVRTRPEPKTLSPASRTREPNIVWDCLVEVMGFEPSPYERSGFGKTVSAIRKAIPVDATAEQIRAAMVARRRAFERHYEGATFTHRCFLKWAELGALAVGGAHASAGAAFGLRELPEGETFG